MADKNIYHNKKKDSYIRAAHILFNEAPLVLERYIDRHYVGGIMVAIEEKEKEIRDKISPADRTQIYKVKGRFQHELFKYYHMIVSMTTLDGCVLDMLISEDFFRPDYRNEVIKCSSQTEKNIKIIEDLISHKYKSPGTTKKILLSALEKSEQHNKEFVNKVETASTEEEKGFFEKKSHHNIRLQKNYHKLVRQLSGTDNIVDNMIGEDALDADDSEDIRTTSVTAEKNRKLLAKIRSEHQYKVFLCALREDSVYRDLAEEIESTEITLDDEQRMKLDAEKFSTKLGLDIMISLMTTLNDINLPTEQPLIDDTSLGADMYRIQTYLGKIVDEDEIDEVQYQEILKILSRIDGHKIEVSTPVVTSDIEKHLENLKCKMENRKLRQQLKDLQYKQTEVIPRHIRDTHILIINEWITKDELFVVTHATDKIINILSNSKVVTIIGSPGSGKSATSRHVAIRLMKQEKFQIVPVSSIDDIIKYSDEKQIFIFDDILGIFGADIQKKNEFERRKDFILKSLGERSKLIMTCRKAVYNAAKLKAEYSLVAQNMIDLEHDDNKLSEEEKYGILSKHCVSNNVSNEHYSSVSFKFANMMFPFLCQLYSTEKRYREIGPRFFTEPYECLLEQFDRIQTENEVHYAALVLCMANNGKLSLQTLKDVANANKKEDICNHCGLNKGTSDFKILDALKEMDHTYVVKVDGYYTFIHDSIFEVTACHYGKQFPDQIMEYMDSSYIANNVSVNPNHQSGSLCLKLESDEEYMLLAQRLYKDLESMELYDVFLSKSLHYLPFLDKFKTFLNEKTFQEVQGLFLTKQPENKVLNIIRQAEKIVKETIQKDPYLDSYSIRIQDTLMDKTVDENDHVTYSIRLVSWIVFYGHTPLLQFLIDFVSKHGKSIDLIFGEDNGEQTRLLILASSSGNFETLQFIYKHVNKECLNGTMLQGHEEKFKNKNMHKCKTPLTSACLRGDEQCIKELIRIGADVNKTDDGLHVPILTAVYSRNWHIVKLLLDNNADINYGNHGNSSPLFTATSLEHIEAVKNLVEMGASVNKGKSDGTTPLSRASERGFLEIVKYLIVEAGANVNKCDKANRSPLYMAAREGKEEVVKILIEYDADVNQCDKNGKSPLYAAANEGHCQTVGILLNHCADVNSGDSQNKTPLFVASEKGYKEVAKMLLKNTADPNIFDIDRRTAYYIANQNKQFEIRTLLQRFGADDKIMPFWSYRFKMRSEELKQLFKNNIFLALVVSLCICVVAILCYKM